MSIKQIERSVRVSKKSKEQKQKSRKYSQSGRLIDSRLQSNKSKPNVQKNLTENQQRKLNSRKAADQAIEKLKLSIAYDQAIDNHAKEQINRTKFEYNSLVNMVAKGAQPMITYVHKNLTEDRKNTVKLLRAVRLFDPIFASRNFGDAPNYHRAYQMVEDLRIYDALNNIKFIEQIKSELPAYFKDASKADGRVPKLAADPLSFHYCASGKRIKGTLMEKLNGRPFIYEAAKKIALLQPTSATVERLNSILEARFGKKRRRGNALSDLITASLMLWQNGRSL